MAEDPAPLAIRRGLRRLEFVPPESREDEADSTHVVVEFAMERPLKEDQVVSINLGVREGLERTLSGVPVRLPVESDRSEEVLYRLEGEVA